MTESLEMTKRAAQETAKNAAREPDDPTAPFSRHVELRTVVLPELQVLFLPIPKAGCTSILWLLAELAGVPEDTFAHSTLPEVSPALTVHDMSLWGPGYRLADYQGDERERVLTEDGWFRFSLVRNPQTRLWSAWQSKLLLREPRFVATFGEEPWFPRIPKEPADLVDDFRRFVAALSDSSVADVHWAVQHALVAQLPLTHVGRVERLDDTLEQLRAHVPADRWPAVKRRENRMNLPMPPSAYDEATAAILQEHYRADFDQFGFEPVDPREADSDAVAEWDERVSLLLPLFRDTIDKHARIGQLHKVALRVQTLEQRLENRADQGLGHSKSPVLTNLEGHTGFNVRWGWAEGELEPGFTAVVRVKNEARSLPFVLPPLLRAVRHVVVVDNGSTDGTGEVAREVADSLGLADSLDVHEYPFSVARCGDEHLGTRAESVHSLAYFYNWSFSHVRTGYSLKWDGDMVLTDTAIQVLRDLDWQLEASRAVVKIPRYPLYVADNKKAFLDLALTNTEPWGWPNRQGYSFAKAMEWELPLWPEEIDSVVLPPLACIELKHLDADEFAHWSPTDFEASARTQRKRREWEVFHALAAGGEPPEGVELVQAPAGTHVIDYVRSVWLPQKAAQPANLGERLLRQLTA